MSKKIYFLLGGIVLLPIFAQKNIKSITSINSLEVEGKGNKVEIGGVNKRNNISPENGENVVIIDGKLKIKGKNQRIIIKNYKSDSQVNPEKIKQEINRKVQIEIEKAKQKINKELKKINKLKIK